MAAHSPTPNGLPSPTETAVWESMAALCLSAALGIAWWLLRACVVGDCHGLQWRGMGGWKSVPWDKVSDYYEKLPTQAQRSSRVSSSTGTYLPSIVSMIETSAGKFGITSVWANSNVLRELVEQQATHSRASYWELKGTRAIDPWPRVFRYDTWQNIWTPRLLLKVVLTLGIYALNKPLMQTIQLTGAVGWPMKLALFGPYLMMFLLGGSSFLLITAQYYAAGRRKAERITADLAGIVFEDGTRRLETNWSDVTRYGMTQGVSITNRYVVETKWGEFDFLSSISHAVLLQEIIRRFATEAAVKDWKPPLNHDALGGEVARWSSGKIGVGARVYHYRTREYRALLWLPLMLCFIFGLMAWLASQGQLPGQNVLGMAWSGAGSGLMLLLGYYAYRTCRIESDEEGLTQVTLVGRRRLRWAQIENYYLTKERSGVVRGRAERISFGPSVVGYEELKAEITQRATDCGGKAWEPLPTTTAPDALPRGRRGRGWSGRG